MYRLEDPITPPRGTRHPDTYPVPAFSTFIFLLDNTLPADREEVAANCWGTEAGRGAGTCLGSRSS